MWKKKYIGAPKIYCGAKNLNCGWVQEPGVAPCEALIPGLQEYTWILMAILDHDFDDRDFDDKDAFEGTMSAPK